jgi:uncharacterized membrane protein YqiK
MRAAGEAAATYEEGKAKAEALRLLREQWEKQDSKDLFMLQLLPELVEKVMDVVSSILRTDR